MKALVTIGAVALAIGCTAEPPETWSYVYATVITPNCTTSACHSALSRPADIALYDREVAYQTLTGRACDDTTTAPAGLVNLTAPEESYLSILLRRDGPTGMPPNARLPDPEIEIVEAWMRSGAPCD